MERRLGMLWGCSFLLFLFSIHMADTIAVMSIDLGGEWIKVAIVKPGVPMEIAMNKESKRKTPAVVSIDGNERFFSDPALSVSTKKPQNAYLYLTHIIGRKYDSPAVKLYQKRFPFYKLLKDPKRETVVFEASSGTKYSPEELLGMILNNSRHIAEDFADHPMKDAVITVPVYFNQAERKAVLNAAKLVGLNVLQLQNDNAAVALHYGIFRMATFNATEKNILFFDMGATSTVATVVGYSTVKVKDRGYSETVPQLVVKGVGFDTTLGGLEMDLKLRDHLAHLFKKQGKAKGDIRKNPRAMAKLLKEAKRVKQVLSANADHYAQVEHLFEEQDFRAKVTRAEFEEMCKDLMARVAYPVKAAMKSAAMPLDSIETVILMGGGTRVPKVQEILLEIVQKPELGKSINTDESAALGAVYKATELTQGFKVKRFLVKDVNLYPIDVSFTRPATNEKGEQYSRVVTRTLFHHLNPLPQKKVMTFNKKPDDFSFNVTYGDASFLGDIARMLHLGKLSEVTLKGVEEAFSKHKDSKPKGVKAYFNLDESCLLNLEKVESHFETVVDQEKKEEEQSTFAKIGSTLSSLFGSSADEKDKKVDENAESKYEEAKGGEEKKEEESKEKDKSSEDSKARENVTKEEPKASDSKKEETKEKESSADGAKNETTAKDGTAGDSNATKAEKPLPKPVLLREEVTATWTGHDVPELTGEALEASAKLLEDFQIRDEEKRATEKARNNLESFIFEFREKLFNEEYDSLSSQDEKDSITSSLSMVSEWLDDEGWDAKFDVFKAKLKELKTLTQELRSRMNEKEYRPRAIAELLNSLNLSSVFLEQVKQMPLSDEIYTEKDLKDLAKIHKESTEWLMVNWAKQNASDPKLKPVMTVKDIANTQGRVDRELMYLINKAKYYVPKPKPKVNDTLKNTTKLNESEADAGGTPNETKGDKPEVKEDKTGDKDKGEDKTREDAGKKEGSEKGKKKSEGDQQEVKEEKETLQLDGASSEEKPLEGPSTGDKKSSGTGEEVKVDSDKAKDSKGKAPDEL